MIDFYNIERSPDGLFNTRGTQGSTREGIAEFALSFSANSLERALLTSNGNTPDTASSIWIERNTRLRIGFGEGTAGVKG